MPVSIAAQAGLVASLHALAEAAEAIRWEPGRWADDRSRARHDQRLDRLRHYVIPRLADPGPPLLVALVGSTGSGKSTLLNGLAGREISKTGALRPITRRPLLWCHPAHARADLETLSEPNPLLEHLSLVDTPDLDSVIVTHRESAQKVLAVADAAVFVTTPQRYADAVPWEVLEGLADRGMPTLVVMNRLTRRSSGAFNDLTAQLRRRLDQAADEVIAVEEHRLRAGGSVLPASAVGRLRRALTRMGDDYMNVLARSLAGSVGEAVALYGG